MAMETMLWSNKDDEEKEEDAKWETDTHGKIARENRKRGSVHSPSPQILAARK